MIRYMGLVLAVLLGMAGLFVVRGCDDEPTPRQYEVYVDTSTSAADRLEGPITMAVTTLISQASEERASITIHPVTAATASAEAIGRADFGAPPEQSSGQYYVGAWIDSEVTRLTAEFTAWRDSSTPVDSTDLVGALIKAAGPASTSSDRDVRVVLVSDGLNYTDDWRWSEGPLDATGCRALADRFDLPGLSGAKVSFQTGGHRALDTNQSVAVARCWEALLHEVGAETPDGWFER